MVFLMQTTNHAKNDYVQNRDLSVDESITHTRKNRNYNSARRGPLHSRPVNLPLPAQLLEAVQNRAKRVGVPYQPFIRMALERALHDPKLKWRVKVAAVSRR
jgi:predicted DNA binding CopG/RHH family protein